VPMAAVLLVAMFTVHLPYGFSSIKLIAVTATGAQFGPPGYECDLLYLVCLAALVMAGPGPLAVDDFIGTTRVGCSRVLTILLDTRRRIGAKAALVPFRL
jgi:putative oxidoreductase